MRSGLCSRGSKCNFKHTSEKRDKDDREGPRSLSPSRTPTKGSGKETTHGVYLYPERWLFSWQQICVRAHQERWRRRDAAQCSSHVNKHIGCLQTISGGSSSCDQERHETRRLVDVFSDQINFTCGWKCCSKKVSTFGVIQFASRSDRNPNALTFKAFSEWCRLD